MLNTITNPVGADFNIGKLQAMLYARLSALWPNTIVWDSYARVYRNKSVSDGWVAEAYLSNGDYKEVYYDDTVDVVSFFGLGTTQNIGLLNSVDVHLVFFVDLSKLKPSLTHRSDSEVISDVLNVIGASAHGFTPVSVETGLQNVLKEYPGSRRDDRLKHVDMQPRLAFRINFELKYSNTNKYC